MGSSVCSLIYRFFAPYLSSQMTVIKVTLLHSKRAEDYSTAEVLKFVIHCCANLTM